MIRDTEHIIGTQQFQITSDDEKNAHHFQSTISILQESRISTLLEKICNQFSDPYSIYRFKQIELNLGSIPPNNFDNELLFRLEEELIQFFKSNIQSDGNLRSGEKIILRNQKLEQLEHFLINGFLKWNSSSSTSPQKILHELISETPEELTELLYRLGKKQEIRKRMILQFPEESLEKVVKHVAKTEGEYIISYKQNMLDHHRKTKFIDTGYSTFRNAIWEVVLSYLFESSNSYYNKKNFLQFLIRKIALKYNLTYQVLLEVISKGVEFEDETAQIPEFKKLIIELNNEEHANPIYPLNTPNKSSSILGIIHELENFLNNQKTSSSSHFLSKKEFESKIQTLFQNPNKITQYHISNWLKNKLYREKLFTLLDQTSISILLELGAKNTLLEISHFINEIEAKKQWLTSKPNTLLRKIILIKPKLILLSLSETERKELILRFLDTIKTEIDFVDDTLFSLLDEIQEKLSTPYQKIIQKFFKLNPKQLSVQQKKNKQNQSIILISEKLQQFVSINPIQLWGKWFKSQIPHWVKKTKLTIPELLEFIKQKLEAQFVSTEIISFIEEEKQQFELSASITYSNRIKSDPQVPFLILDLVAEELNKIELIPFTSWSIQVIGLFQKISAQYKISFVKLFKTFVLRTKHQSQTEIYRALQKLSSSSEYHHAIEGINHQENRTKYKTNVSYILHKGKWPWWNSNYRKEQFNHDFKKLWQIPSEQKSLLKIIKSKSVIPYLHSFLDIQNTYTIWKKLDTSIQNTYAKLFISIHKLLQQNLIPVSSISRSNLVQFITEVFYYLNQSTSTKKDIPSFFQNWLGNTFIIQNIATRNLWIQTLQNIAEKSNLEVRNQISSWIESLNKTALDTTREKVNIVQLFINNYYQEIQLSKTPPLLIDQIEQVSLQKPHVFNQWITQTEFRNHLIHQFSETDLIHIVHLKLNGTQQHFFNEISHVIDQLLILLSSSESLKFQHILFNQIFLEVGNQKINTWDIKKWSDLVSHSLTKLVSPQKAILLLNQNVIKNANNLNLLLVQNIIKNLESYSSNPNLLSSLVTINSDTFLNQLTEHIQKQQNTSTTSVLLSELFEKHFQWFNEIYFRAKIVEKVNEKELNTSIEKTLSNSQKEYFKITLNFIHRIDIPTLELKKVKTQFYQLLLLKLSSGGFTSWSFNNWSILLAHVIKDILGSSKSLALILTEKEILMSDSKSPSKTNFEFLQLIQKEFQPDLDISTESIHSKEQDYRKLGEKEKREYLDPIYVNYSGLILLAPYLGMLFKRCGLIQNNEFIDSESQSKAVHFLDYAATGSVGKEEHELIINKILCGMEITDPITSITDLTTQEKEIIDSLLTAVTQQWTPLKNSSIDGFRNSFLERTGKLEEDTEAFYLKVEQKAYDMLLDQIPWNITQIKLSWMDKILQVEWR
jgi:hypothetical protein